MTYISRNMNKWTEESIEKTFKKSSYGDIERMKINLKETLRFYKGIRKDNEELKNRIQILEKLINKYNKTEDETI